MTALSSTARDTGIVIWCSQSPYEWEGGIDRTLPSNASRRVRNRIQRMRHPLTVNAALLPDPLHEHCRHLSMYHSPDRAQKI